QQVHSGDGQRPTLQGWRRLRGHEARTRRRPAGVVVDVDGVRYELRHGLTVFDVDVIRGLELVDDLEPELAAPPRCASEVDVRPGVLPSRRPRAREVERFDQVARHGPLRY